MRAVLRARRALFAPVLAGAKPLLTCSSFTSAYQTCLLVKDAGKYHIMMTNDYDFQKLGDDADGLPLAALQNSDRYVTMSLAPLSIPATSWIVVSEVSTAGTSGYYGEVSLLQQVSAFKATYGISTSTFMYFLPAYAAARITVPAGPQAVKAIPASADASLFAGANVFKNYGTLSTLTVATSGSSTHDKTGVAIVQFSLANYSVANVAILELTVSTAPSSTQILSVIGINPAAPPVWTEAGISWSSATWAVSTPTGYISTISKNFALMCVRLRMARLRLPASRAPQLAS
jgi:hypothetical protein